MQFLKHTYYRIKFHFQRTDKKSRIGIFTFVLLGMINAAAFNFHSFYNNLEYLEPFFNKSYVSFPLAIGITFFISYLFYRKNKPVQEMWNIKRGETIDSTITYTRQSSNTIRTIENAYVQKQQVNPRTIQLLTQSDLPSLIKICEENHTYLTNKEVRCIRMYVKFLSNYLKYLFNSTHTEMEDHNVQTDIAMSEGMIVNLLVDFRVKDKTIIDQLTQPLSNHIADKDTIQHREISQVLLGNTIL